MSTLYPQPRRHSVIWTDFNGKWRYVWFRDPNAPDSGTLRDWRSPDSGHINNGVTLAQAERSLRQLGHTIGEWDA